MMNCLDARRALLAAPRERTRPMTGHLAACVACANIAERMDDLDGRLAEAFLVPVPDALAERVLLSRRGGKPPAYRAVAAAAVAAIGLGLAASQLWEKARVLDEPAEAVGPSHLGVKAIEVVVDQQPGLVDEPQGKALVAMREDLERLGLKLNDTAKVDYAGKCYMPETQCDHLVLETPEGRVSVVLVPDYPVGERAIVVDRSMTALVNPARSGGYIVVAASAKAAKRAAKLFSKS